MIMSKNNKIDGIWQFKKLNKSEQLFGIINRQINDLIIKCSNTKGTETDADLIIDNIWLGNMYVAHDYNFVVSKGIKSIINVTDDVPNKFTFIDYCNFFIKDIDACDEDLIKLIEYGADVVHEAVSNNGPVLVHCKRGHHRSASVIAFYLMKYHKMSLIDAISYIKCIRPTAFRRMTCLLQNLILYEYNRQ